MERDQGGGLGGEVAVRLGGSRQDDAHHAEEARLSREITVAAFETATGRTWRPSSAHPRAGRLGDRIYIVAPRYGGWTVAGVIWVNGSRRGAL
jgi:hypothetical protein